MTISIPLAELPLRPSTLQLFAKRGFETVQELEDSKLHGGISNLAAELEVSLAEAAGLVREVQGCFETTTSINKNDNGPLHPPATAVAAVAVSPQESHRNLRIADRTSPEMIAGGSTEFLEGTSTSTTTTTEDYYSLGIQTAYDLLNNKLLNEQDGTKFPSRDIVTFCRTMDELLGGGIALGQVTEIAGMPGCGKTQLAIQLAVLTRLIPDLGGVHGQTLYVDCEGSFLPERAWQMAKAVSEHARRTALRRSTGRDRPRRSTNPSDPASEDDHWNDLVRQASALTPEEILNSIHVYRVHDETALLATLFSLQDYIEQQTQSKDKLPVRLVVVDSIAFHFRAVPPTDSQYYIHRTKTLTQVAAYLGDLAQHYNLAVVTINQMTTKVVQQRGASSNDSSTISTNVPALGESWAHSTTTRLLLKMKEVMVSTTDDDGEGDDTPKSVGVRQQVRQERTCTLMKSLNRPPGTVAFQITHDGIRDVPHGTKHIGSALQSSQGHSSQKRHRTS